MELNLKSIAFPAIGTGTLAYPVDLVASEMFQAAKDFCVNKPNANITVTIVVYNQDTNMIKVYATFNTKVIVHFLDRFIALLSNLFVLITFL